MDPDWKTLAMAVREGSEGKGWCMLPELWSHQVLQLVSPEAAGTVAALGQWLGP